MIRNLIFGLLCSSVALPLGAETYRFTAPATPKQIVEGRLDMGGVKPEYVFAGGRTFRPEPGLKSTFSHKGVKVTTLTREQALDAMKVDSHLLVTKATVLPDEGGATLLSLGQPEVDKAEIVPEYRLHVDIR